MAQLQHNIRVTSARSAALLIITGGGKWIEMTIPADALYQHFLVTAERRFWRCVQTGETPRPYGIEPPRARIEAVRIVDMSESNSWAEFRQEHYALVQRTSIWPKGHLSELLKASVSRTDRRTTSARARLKRLITRTSAAGDRPVEHRATTSAPLAPETESDWPPEVLTLEDSETFLER